MLAGLPNLVSEDDLASANALLQVDDWMTTAIGPIVGGAIVGASGPDLVYWVNAVTFAISAALLVRDPRRGCCRATGDRPRAAG